MASIRKRADDSYQIRVSCGYTVIGKQISKTMTYKPAPGMTERQIQKAVEKAALEFEMRVENGLCVDGNARFADFSENWLALNENNLAPKTYERYKTLLSRIIPGIGHIRLGKLQAQHLQELYNNLGEDGMNKKTGGKLSARTILHHHRLISTILKEALKQGYVARDVSALTTPPKPQSKEVEFLDEPDALRLYYALSDEPLKWKTALLTLLYTGIRRGELIGLQWGDIDFESQLITIRRTVQYVTGKKYEHIDDKGVFRKGRLIEKPPNTKESARPIAVDEHVIALLKHYKAWWDEQRELNGSQWIPTDKLFITVNGGVMHPDSLNDYVGKFFIRHQLPHFSPHTLRHTNISMMIAQGVDIKTVSARAGHSNVSTTGNIYTHQIKSANAKAAEKLGNIFKNIPVPELTMTSRKKPAEAENGEHIVSV
jgi:integrase